MYNNEDGPGRGGDGWRGGVRSPVKDSGLVTGSVGGGGDGIKRGACDEKG